jgi:hypothetical protein
MFKIVLSGVLLGEDIAAKFATTYFDLKAE